MASKLILAGFMLAIYSLLITDVYPERIDCYSCINCGDPFDAKGTTMVSCSDSCMKTKTEMKDGQHVVVRSCGTKKVNECKKEKLLGFETNICTCTKPKCNGANSFTVQLYVSLTVAALVLATKKMLI